MLSMNLSVTGRREAELPFKGFTQMKFIAESVVDSGFTQLGVWLG